MGVLNCLPSLFFLCLLSGGISFYFMIVFHLLSIYLCVQDFKRCSINIVAYIFCLLSLILEIWTRKIPIENLEGIILFLCSIALLTFIYKKQIIGAADVIYALFCLWIIGDRYYLYFICIGIFSIITYFVMHKYLPKSIPNDKSKKIPYLPILYGAFIICYYL